jgi:hypothetical protein
MGMLAFAGLWYRRRCLRSAVYIVSEWVLGAVGLVVGFLTPLPNPHTFAPIVEPLSRRAEEPPEWSGRTAEQA